MSPFGSVFLLVVLVVAYLALTWPVYLIAQRSGNPKPWIAFIPIFGGLIVLLEATGQSGWLALAILIPYFGALAIGLWLPFALPKRHGRTLWWALALLVPLVNLVSYWAYALTLPDDGVGSDRAVA